MEERYWDDEEFDFFNQLDDLDKLLYIYELMIADFSESDFDDGISIDNSIDDILSDIDSFTITAETEIEAMGVLNLMTMNGILVTDVKFESHPDSVSVFCKLLGKVMPISVN